MVSPDNPFTRMQKAMYGQESAQWTTERRDPVVGSFDAHNAHEDYDLLFRGIETAGKVALDFGCGPGRNIVRFRPRFGRIDGVDLDQRNLVNATLWCQANNVPVPNLSLCSGVDLAEIPDETYDVVFSTICLQHISVHEIRLNYFREFHRVLRPGGWLTAQMGFGEKAGMPCVDYFANFYEAEKTNGHYDVCVESPDQLRGDLEACWFYDFRHEIRPAGPGDTHANWIFFQARRL